jgi:DNA-binding GntR family transcriptional regulator
MAKRNGALTLTESVFSELRNHILSGKLSPGAPLMPAELRLYFNVSVAVIREALTRLAEKGLAKQSPNHGFTVMTLSDNELKNIIVARSINEGAALQLAISKGDVIWESNIVAINHQLEQTPKYLIEDKTSVDDNWSAIHGRFHHALLEACDNPILLDICARLWDISELYRHWAIPHDSNRDIISEHTTLMQAVITRNSERAVALYNAHIRLTVDVLLQHPKKA